MNYRAWLAKADMIQGPEQVFTGLDVDTDVARADIGDYAPTFTGEMEQTNMATQVEYTAVANAILLITFAERNRRARAAPRGCAAQPTTQRKSRPKAASKFTSARLIRRDEMTDCPASADKPRSRCQ